MESPRTPSIRLCSRHNCRTCSRWRLPVIADNQTITERSRDLIQLCGCDANKTPCTTTEVVNYLLFTLYYIHTQSRLTAFFPGLPRWAGTRKVKPIWILLKQQTVSGSGISWAICKSAPRSRQITTPARHHSSFLQAGCPSCRPTNSVKALKANTKSTATILSPFCGYNMA